MEIELPLQKGKPQGMLTAALSATGVMVNEQRTPLMCTARLEYTLAAAVLLRIMSAAGAATVQLLGRYMPMSGMPEAVRVLLPYCRRVRVCCPLGVLKPISTYACGAPKAFSCPSAAYSPYRLPAGWCRHRGRCSNCRYSR